MIMLRKGKHKEEDFIGCTHIYTYVYVPMLVCRIKHIPYVTQFELRFYAIYTTKVLTKYYSITYNISIVSSKHRRNFRV